MSSHIDQVWPELLKQAIQSPKCDAKQDSIREILGCHVVLDGSMEQFGLNSRRRLSPIYASAELLWYLSRSKSGDMIKAYAPQYEQFLDDGNAYGAYGARLANNLEVIAGAPYGCDDELTEAIRLLKARPTTKKCVVSLWEPNDLVAHRLYKDIPCTIAWQFRVIGEKLHMLCYMRSNDLWKGFLYDVYVNTVIQRYVASCLGLTAGDYHHIAGSEHLYERDVKKAEEALLERTEHEPYHPSSNYWSMYDLKATLKHEYDARTSRPFGEDDEYERSVCSLPDRMYDAYICCEAKFCPNQLSVPRSPGLRKAMEQYLCTEKS